MFNQEQEAHLKAPLDRAHVATRTQSGRNLSYIEGWHAIAEANRIFGFHAWQRETIELRLVAEYKRKIGSGERAVDGWGVSYICRVRVTVRAGDAVIVRDGIGSGHGIDRDVGLAHESAVKEAETDAMKRALMTFGNPFGLALYDKSQSQVADAPAAPALPQVEPAEFLQRWQRMLAQAETLAALEKLKADTTPEREAIYYADADAHARVQAEFKKRKAAVVAMTAPQAG